MVVKKVKNHILMSKKGIKHIQILQMNIVYSNLYPLIRNNFFSKFQKIFKKIEMCIIRVFLSLKNIKQKHADMTQNHLKKHKQKLSLYIYKYFHLIM